MKNERRRKFRNEEEVIEIFAVPKQQFPFMEWIIYGDGSFLFPLNCLSICLINSTEKNGYAAKGYRCLSNFSVPLICVFNSFYRDICVT